MAKVAWANVGSKIITRLNKLGFLDENTYTPSSGDTITWDGSEWVPDNTTYAPAVTEITLGVQDFDRNAATIQITTGVHGMSFADGSNQWIVATIGALPDDWTTFDIQVEAWVASATGNDVRMRFDYAFLGNGDTVAVVDGTPVDLTVGSANTLVEYTIATAQSVTVDKDLSLRVIRLGGATEDTHAAAFIVKSVRLVKAS